MSHDIKYLKSEKGGEKTDEGTKTGDSIDASITSSLSITAQADIVKGLIVQGAYKIAKDFIDFIETKASAEKEKPKEEV